MTDTDLTGAHSTGVRHLQLSYAAPTSAGGRAGTARKRDSMLTRGLALLSAFGPGDTEVTLSELARRSGLPKPTAHRLVAELLDSGFLERGQRGLLLGRQMFVLADRLPPDQKIRGLALPHLQRLRAVTGATAVYLSAVRGRDVVHLLRVGQLDDAGERVVDLGARRALARTAGPLLRLEDAGRANAVLACRVALPGQGAVAAVSAVCAAGQDPRRLLAPELHRTARELAARIAALPGPRPATGAA